MYERARAYFLSVWRGERSLAVTFWLWYVLVVLILVYVLGFVLAQLAARFFSSDEPYIWYLAFVIIGTAWGNVGLWRSAARTGGIWSILARVVVVVLGLTVTGMVCYILASGFGLV